MLYVYDDIQLFYSPWDSSGQNTGAGSLFLLQGTFPTQGSKPGFSHCRQIHYQGLQLKLCNSIVTKLRSSGSLLKSQYLRGKCQQKGKIALIIRLATYEEGRLVSPKPIPKLLLSNDISQRKKEGKNLSELSRQELKVWVLFHWVQAGWLLRTSSDSVFPTWYTCRIVKGLLGAKSQSSSNCSILYSYFF